MDGVYTFEQERPRFHRSTAPTRPELQRLLRIIATRVTRALEGQGLLIRDDETPSLDLEPADGFEHLLGAAVHYRIATGPHAGRKALTLRTVASHPPASDPCIAQLSGFSLHSPPEWCNRGSARAAEPMSGPPSNAFAATSPARPSRTNASRSMTAGRSCIDSSTPSVTGPLMSCSTRWTLSPASPPLSEVFPHAEQRDDCFHVLYEMNKVRRRLERRAYAAIEREGEALGRLGKIRAYDKERRRKAKRELSSARRECAEAIERFDEFEAAMDTLRGALECVDIKTGELHRPEHVQALIEGVAQRIESLGVGECAKLAKYLRNRAPGLVLAQKSVLPRLEALAEPWSAQAVSLACLCWYLVRALHKRPARARHRALYRHLLTAYGALQDRLGAASASLLDAVEEVLHQRHRASSAIEGFNAALRPYLYVHKGATQGFLDLFRAWFNLRTRRWGRHKGTSAHECLTGQRVHDWLTLLGCPPSPTLH